MLNAKTTFIFQAVFYCYEKQFTVNTYRAGTSISA